MSDEAKPVCCDAFVLWDKKKCCVQCHAREQLPFRLRFNGHDCQMCCNACEWATKAFHVVDMVEGGE